MSDDRAILSPYEGITMSDATRRGIARENHASNTAPHQRKDFWDKENLNFNEPWYRLEKSARIVNRLAQGRECTLLDIGCGPATFMRLLSPNIQYYGIDIAIHDSAPNLMEADIVEAPIRFAGKQFDIVIAQGIFEYVRDVQSQKFAEIAQLLKADSKFIVSYWNFGHRKQRVYPAFSNIQSFDDFRKDLAQHFNIDKFFPTSHNWAHGEPRREFVKSINMHINVNIPIVSPILAVEYYFICSPLSA